VSETYIVLVAETEGGKLKTALVHEDTFKREPYPRDYFRSGKKIA